MIELFGPIIQEDMLNEGKVALVRAARRERYTLSTGMMLSAVGRLETGMSLFLLIVPKGQTK
jgi:hypothetical protein